MYLFKWRLISVSIRYKVNTNAGFFDGQNTEVDGVLSDMEVSVDSDMHIGKGGKAKDVLVFVNEGRAGEAILYMVNESLAI